MQTGRASQSQCLGAGPSSKVAIPRLERRDDPNPAASEKHRVIKAVSSLFVGVQFKSQQMLIKFTVHELSQEKWVFRLSAAFNT